MALLGSTYSARALGPHEVLVLVNSNSQRSTRIADSFVKSRHVPQLNVVQLALPDSLLDTPRGIRRADFTEHIWRPVMRDMRKRQIDDHILAWVYSSDFPTTVLSAPRVSLQGITFVRNRLPPAESIEKGAYTSPLFAGPGNVGGIAHYPQTFDLSARWLGDDMPLPSMMLGHTGRAGNSEEVVMKCIARGVACDGTAPTGTVWFVKGDGVRSNARAWQFQRARRELMSLNVAAEITPSFPAGQRDVIGVMMGAKKVKPQKLQYRPGSMAEHLTSLAAVFSTPNQTKLTEWLAAGATASAGTVTEPYALWTKFPAARFFVHYASGCSMIESFFQSIRCPLQILLVGEPLASPWRSKAQLVLSGLAESPLSGKVELGAVVESRARPRHYGDFVVLLDGRVVDRGPSARLDTADMTNGPHALRVVAYGTGMVRNQVFAEVQIKIKNRQ